ncbi:hypothetical protein VNI00_009223 [Paramarasmius palmivorus]|uniref:Glycoside hydrolase family 76 protein n=1 Tax=Paramarasmius palmivorus TaxID=297713 RepID=A0AAW0CUH3_9AGAR
MAFKQKPGIEVSLEEGKNLANAALENAIDMLNENLTCQNTFVPSQHLLNRHFFLQVRHDIERTLGIQVAISDMDLLTSQTNKMGLALDFIKRYPTADILLRAFNMKESAFDTLLFGYAAMQAYTAYQRPQFLKAASDSWNHARNYALLTEDIKSGARDRLLNYNYLQSSCQGETMAGGVGDGGAVCEAVRRLSAMLFEASSNETYKDAAIQSENFIRKQLYRNQGLILYQKNNQNCKVVTNDFAIQSAGFWIQGLSIWASISGDSSLTSLLSTQILRLKESVLAVTTQTTTEMSWQREDGIQVNDNPPTWNSYLICGLRTAYIRLNSSNTDLKSYIQGYIGVQYNALLDLATRDQSNIYTGSWAGPPSSALEKENQISASEVLISGIPLLFAQNPTNPEPTPSDQPPVDPGVRTTATSAGPIAGGAIGGIVLIAAIVVVLIWYRRRYRLLFHVPSLTPFVQDPDDRTPQPNLRSRNKRGDIGQALEPAINASNPSGPPPSYI